jgi:hypothetical protein
MMKAREVASMTGILFLFGMMLYLLIVGLWLMKKLGDYLNHTLEGTLPKIEHRYQEKHRRMVQYHQTL